MSKFEVWLYCADCFSQDFQGCFDGGEELQGTFDTREEAAKCGDKALEGLGANHPWRVSIRVVNAKG